MKNNNKKSRRLSVSEVKQILSEEEFAEAKHKIENATRTLEDVKSVLSSALFLRNGKLSTGTIDYAAFRIETLSLIFEIASQNFRKSAKSGPKAYDEFLLDLGEEVGFTFAKGVVSRVKSHDLFLEVQNIKKLLQLWALFENDTGAGETILKSCSREKIVIQLKNNPLRRVESSPHAHCGFYRNYIRSFLNELHTVRARLLQQEVEQATVEALKVVNVEEQPDAEDNCVFLAELRPEILTRSFDALYDAYEQFDKLSEAEDFSPCLMQARSALVSAQMESIRLDDERAPRQLFKVFEKILPRNDFRRMDEVYQVTSKYIHGEAASSGKLTKIRCREILRDVRRSVYAFEFLDITEKERNELRNKAMLNDRLALLTELVQKTEQLGAEEKRETVQFLSQVKKGKLIEEKKQVQLVQRLNRLGGKVWEVAKPILTEVITAAIKKQYGL